ncbi:FAD binding domain-containing protein [Paraburkholderia silvatlantica]|uniref:Carbon-monoxide dehydrogenase medium subunit n=1 Tax=Paraburkholderia silvatlantica TaxID=321895 RepID=A0A2U1A7X8_9BURK|nr:FAD binding domain-containing protein [Paraburkholderia silvatlantica]MBB2931174.1 carbon-monoxide dehydrogenase medium subunit [Paraburkholderia silvatlantica]PVY28666.1 carbon-monoxide dehydrogenase medium subunit [Paraburkholderia silvatlantica]PXW36303.1 carbon-monoxide dehydrogenase medium subunit [Paraburkholderia silvatlantica]PYE21626.1 carbon-monoxide dehydrogenase medium subunit [Paraburkholderia silvatlantica]
MKAAPYDYAKPVACDEAIALIGPADGNGKFVAGSQSLGPMMNLRLAQPERLVDLRGIEALRACRIENEVVTLGACITHAQIEDGKIDTGTRGFMEHVARGIAYRAVRNRGTLGGSLVHADPAADWINSMCALDAQCLVSGPGGTRTIGNGEWMSGAFTTALEADEILTAVRFTRLSPTARWSYYKVNRKPGEFAQAIAVFIDDAVRGVCRAVIGALDAPPYAIADARELLAADPPAACFDAHLEAAGVEAGSYEHEVHRAALVRAAADIRNQKGSAS